MYYGYREVSMMKCFQMKVISLGGVFLHFKHCWSRSFDSKTISKNNIQSTPVISNSKGLTETL